MEFIDWVVYQDQESLAALKFNLIKKKKGLKDQVKIPNLEKNKQIPERFEVLKLNDE